VDELTAETLINSLTQASHSRRAEELDCDNKSQGSFGSSLHRRRVTASNSEDSTAFKCVR